MMASYFLIHAGGKNELDLKGQSQGKVTFDVTNATEKALRVRARAVQVDATKAEWLSLEGEPEFDMAVKGTSQVTVKITLPAGTAPGRYQFRLDVASVAEPQEIYAEGQRVAAIFTPAGAPPPKKAFPWWILIVVGAVVLLVTGLVIFLVERKPEGSTTSTDTGKGNETKGAKMPPLKGKNIVEAILEIQKMGLELGALTRKPGKTAGEVLAQKPDKDADVQPGDKVDLEVTEGTVAIPPDKLNLIHPRYVPAVEGHGTVGPAMSHLAAPVQLEPQNGAKLTHIPRELDLSWRAVPGAAHYAIVVEYLDQTWKPMAVPATIPGTSFKLTFPGAHQGRWQVSAVDARGTHGTPSPWREFVFEK